MRRAATALAMLVVSAAPAPAQRVERAAAVSVGSRVRVSGPGLDQVTGIVIARRGDTLDVRSDGTGETIALPLPLLTTVDVSVGRQQRRWRGAGWGFVAGAGVGAIIGAVSYRKPDCQGATFICDTGRGLDATAGALFGGLAGAAAGAVVGGGSTEKWEPVIPNSRAGMGLVFPRDRRAVGLRFSVAF